MLMVDFISNVYKGETMGTDRLPELKIKNERNWAVLLIRTALFYAFLLKYAEY